MSSYRPLLKRLWLTEKPIAFLTALLSFLGVIAESVGLLNLFDAVSPFADVIGYLLGSILCVALVYLAFNALRKRSQLAPGTSLRLDPEDPDCLIGREEITRQLCDDCSSEPMSFLIGESGAGKTALLAAGVCHTLRQSTSLLAIYVELSANDWNRGARDSLTAALRDALAPDRLAELTADRADDSFGAISPTSEHLEALLRRCPRRINLRPVVIVDQFDDYQTRHRDRFFTRGTSTWLTPGQLTGRNEFWRLIRTLLDDRILHCLIASRADASDGTFCVHLVPNPKVHRLSRLSISNARTVIDRMTTPPPGDPSIVLDPAAGWNDLRDALSLDLMHEGAVLPARLKLALMGLAQLPALTLTAYVRAGRLVGLEREFIAFHVREAARIAGTDRDVVLSLLASLVTRRGDQGSDTPELKSRQVLYDEALAHWQSLHFNAATFSDCIAYLKQENIVRSRIDPDTNREVLLLAHDTLCHGVVQAERHAQRHRRDAEDAYDRHRRASGHTLQRWATLLSPTQQLKLLWARLRGQFSYNGLRAYAALSLLRFLPLAAVVGALIAAFYLGSAESPESRDLATRENARRILGNTGNLETRSIDSAEQAALRELSGSSDDVKVAFVRFAFEANSLVKVSRRSTLYMHAVSVNDPVARSRIVTEVLDPILVDARSSPRATMAALKCTKALKSAPASRPTAVARVARHALSDQQLIMTDLSFLSSELRDVRDDLPQQQADELHSLALSDSLYDRVNPTGFRMAIIHALGPRVYETQPEADRIATLQFIRRYQVSPEPLTSFFEPASPAVASILYDDVSRALREAEMTSEVLFWSAVLAQSDHETRERHAHIAIDSLLERLKTPIVSDERDQLLFVATHFVPHMTIEQRRVLAAHALSVITDQPHWMHISEPCRTLISIAEHYDQPERDTLVDALLESALEHDFEGAADLAQAATSIDCNLAARPLSKILIDDLIERMNGEEGGPRIPRDEAAGLSLAFSTLSVVASERQAERAFSALLPQLAAGDVHGMDSTPLIIGVGLKDALSRMSPTARSNSIRELIAIIDKNPKLVLVEPLIPELMPHLSTEKARELLAGSTLDGRLLSAIARDPASFQLLVSALPASERVDILEQQTNLLIRNGFMPGSAPPSYLVAVLQTIPENRHFDVAEFLIDHIRNSGDAEQLATLVLLLSSLPIALDCEVGVELLSDPVRGGLLKSSLADPTIGERTILELIERNPKVSARFHKEVTTFLNWASTNCHDDPNSEGFVAVPASSVDK